MTNKCLNCGASCGEEDFCSDSCEKEYMEEEDEYEYEYEDEEEEDDE